MRPTSTLSLLALVALTACNGKDQPAPDQSEPEPFELARFASCDEVHDFATRAYVDLLVQSYYGYGYDMVLEDGTATAAPNAGGGADGEGRGPSDYSDTNVQEQGVDEPDIVKTDGERMFVAEGTQVHAVRSWPVADTELLTSVDVGGVVSSMFLAGDRLVVFSTDWSSGYWERGWQSAPTRISILDVADAAAPAIVREIEVEGSYVNARMIGDDMYVVTSSWANVPDRLWDLLWSNKVDMPEVDWNARPAEQRRARLEARARLTGPVAAIVADMPIEDLVPMVRDSLANTEAPLLACTDLYRPFHHSRPSVLSLTHLDVAEGEAGSALSSTGLMSDGWTVYASPESLYISQTSQAWWMGFGTRPEANTRIHKFDLEGAQTTYAGTGRVEGYLLNQWSMSEHDGFLRVATTDMDWWGGDDGAEPANNVFVLSEGEGVLDVVGELRGIAPNEQIYTARFMGDIGFMVTFEQIDPLFSLDLSDPTAPRVVGELEVPGYSSYLHPAGDKRLLAVGMDGTPDGRITDFQVSLYDVSDLSQPKRVAMQTLSAGEWSWSEALWDHHAFLYHRGVLSVPVTTSGPDPETGAWRDFSGLWVLDVDTEADTLTELGRVDHADLAAESECQSYGYGYGYGYGYAEEGDSARDCGWAASMRRSVAIEDNLFSVSNVGVKVTGLEVPEVEHARVVFHPLGE